MDNSNLHVVQDSLVAENIFLSIKQKDILVGATIRADKGKITGLLGRNGAGKTTMLQSVYGIGNVTECDVFLNGKKIKKPYTVNGLINYLPQKAFLPKEFTIKKLHGNLGLSWKLYSVISQASRATSIKK